MSDKPVLFVNYESIGHSETYGGITIVPENPEESVYGLPRIEYGSLVMVGSEAINSFLEMMGDEVGLASIDAVNYFLERMDE